MKIPSLRDSQIPNTSTDSAASQNSLTTPGFCFNFPLVRQKHADQTLPHLLLALAPLITVVCALIAKAVRANQAETDEDDSEEEMSDPLPSPVEPAPAVGAPMLMCSLPQAVSSQALPVGDPGSGSVSAPAPAACTASITPNVAAQDDPIFLSGSAETRPTQTLPTAPDSPSSVHIRAALTPGEISKENPSVPANPPLRPTGKAAAEKTVSLLGALPHTTPEAPGQPLAADLGINADMTSVNQQTTAALTTASTTAAITTAVPAFNPLATSLSLQHAIDRQQPKTATLLAAIRHEQPPPQYRKAPTHTFTCNGVTPMMSAEGLRSVLRPYFSTPARFFSPSILSNEVWKTRPLNATSLLPLPTEPALSEEAIIQGRNPMADDAPQAQPKVSTPHPPELQSEQSSERDETEQRAVLYPGVNLSNAVFTQQNAADRPVRPVGEKEDKYAWLTLTGMNGQRTWHPGWALVLLIVVIILFTSSLVG